MTSEYIRPPEKEEYDACTEEILSGFAKIGGLSFLLHGSYERGNYTPGTSDIDGILILETTDGVTDKSVFSRCSTVYHSVTRKYDIPVQIAITDTFHFKDGRFHSFSESWLQYMVNDAVPKVGIDYRKTFRVAKLPTDGHLLSYSLRKARKSLLNWETTIAESHRVRWNNFKNSFDTIITGTKRIIHASTDEVHYDKADIVMRLQNLFPDLELPHLKHMLDLKSRPSEFYRLQEHPGAMRHVLERGLTDFERALHAYCITHSP